MIQRRWFAAALVLAACGGAGGAPEVKPANTASAAVQDFMKAVADSNLAAMAGLWGTRQGPADMRRGPARTVDLPSRESGQLAGSIVTDASVTALPSASYDTTTC